MNDIPINCKKQVLPPMIDQLSGGNNFIELSETDWNFGTGTKLLRKTLLVCYIDPSRQSNVDTYVKIYQHEKDKIKNIQYNVCWFIL